MTHQRAVRRSTLALVFSFCGLFPALAHALRPYPIMFATQVPIPADFTAIGSVFGNHEGDIDTVGRGGDLYILYPDNTLRNLTAEAGYGVATGFQGATSIAVREPCVHWTGNKAVFSMVIGAPTAIFQGGTWYWQLYEVTGLAQNQTATITPVANQPVGYNNVSPCYASDGKILFTSDRPRNGATHLHPQLDEYEEAETVTGVWLLDPANGALKLLDHAPSGDFTPIVDSFGRVIFTRWDHLQRDQQADQDYDDEQASNPPTFGTFNWSSEAANATALATRAEVFPEARAARPDLLPAGVLGHSFNHFFPWMANQDGSELETLNHIGRHELHSYFQRAFDSSIDPNEVDFSPGGRFNPNPIFNLLQIREKPTGPAGVYVGVDGPEFATHASGQIVSLPGEPGRPADQIGVTYITHRDTENVDDTPGPCHSGLYRNPLPLSDGALIAVHSGERSPGVPETRVAANDGTRALPVARYALRMVDLVPDGACPGYQKYGSPLLPTGIVKSLSFFDPDVQVFYNSVRMWELNPVEVRSRPAPPLTSAPLLPAPEAAVFASEHVDPTVFRNYLKANSLALIISRNVTTRDIADEQQPYNLRVPGGVTTAPDGSPILDVQYMQLYQADLIRGLGGNLTPNQGRRVLAQPMHDAAGFNPPGGPPSSVQLGLDGSMAAMVPAHRAMTWHLTAPLPNATPLVRERYWLTFQAGEMRVCASCHGLNSQDQTTASVPTNQPAALHTLLQYWKTSTGAVMSDGFEAGNTGSWAP
jgi:hypothetical protein